MVYLRGLTGCDRRILKHVTAKDATSARMGILAESQMA
jgi:hypothetical protein